MPYHCRFSSPSQCHEASGCVGSMTMQGGTTNTAVRAPAAKQLECFSCHGRTVILQSLNPAAAVGMTLQHICRRACVCALRCMAPARGLEVCSTQEDASAAYVNSGRFTHGSLQHNLSLGTAFV